MGSEGEQGEMEMKVAGERRMWRVAGNVEAMVDEGEGRVGRVESTGIYYLLSNAFVKL